MKKLFDQWIARIERALNDLVEKIRRAWNG